MFIYHSLIFFDCFYFAISLTPLTHLTQRISAIQYYKNNISFHFISTICFDTILPTTKTSLNASREQFIIDIELLLLNHNKQRNINKSINSHYHKISVWILLRPIKTTCDNKDWLWSRTFLEYLIENRNSKIWNEINSRSSSVYNLKLLTSKLFIQENGKLFNIFHYSLWLFFIFSILCDFWRDFSEFF